MIVEIKGFDEVRKRLDEFPEKLQKKVVRQGLKAGINVILDEAKATTPVGSTYWNKGKSPGTLRNAITSRVCTKQGQPGSVMLLTHGKSSRGIFVKNDAFYWRFVEYGHAMIRKNKKIGKVMPIPFLRTAISKKWQMAVEKAKEYIVQRLDEGLR